MNFGNLDTWLNLGALLIGGLIAARLGPKDHERAAQLGRIANDVAAGIVAMKPGAAWGELLEATVRTLTNTAATPTSNSEAIRRAAIAALLQFGKKPS